MMEPVVKPIVQEFSFEDLDKASHGFCNEYRVGIGSSGMMFYAKLDSGEPVAFRVLHDLYWNPLTRDEFLNQVNIIVSLEHVNVLKLHGYSVIPIDNEEVRMLVYEFASYQSLYNELHGATRPAMRWSHRLDIAIDVARGLEHLHQKSIAYQDLKSTNVLLFDDYRAKIGDINILYRDSNLRNVEGLKRFYHPQTEYSYYDIHHLRKHDFRIESDAFSFGVLLVELLTGKEAYDMGREGCRKSIISWAVPFLGKEKILEILDSRLESGSCSPNAVAKLGALAMYCVLPPPPLRPNMGFLIDALELIRDEPTADEIEKKVQAAKCNLGNAPFGGRVVEVVQRILDEKNDYTFYPKVWAVDEELSDLDLDANKEMLMAWIWFLKY